MKFLLIIALILLSLVIIAQDSTNRSDRPANQTSTETDFEKIGIKDKIRNLRIGRGIKNTRDNLAITVILNLAKAAENQDQYLSAIQHYQKVIDLYAGQGDQQLVSEYSQHIATLYQKAGRDKQALDQYEKVLDRKEALGDTTSLDNIRKQLANLQTHSPISIDNPEWDQLPWDTASQESERLRYLAETTESNKDYKQSLEYYKLYTELSNRLKDEEQLQLLAMQEKTFQLEKQAQQMSLLQSEKEIHELTLAQQEGQLIKEQKFRRNLLIGIILLLGGVLTTFFLYTGKKKALGALHQAYYDLSQTKNKLVSAEQQLKSLLDQQVSKGVAKQLLNSSGTDQAHKKFVCVMFLDIREFTPFAEQL